MRQTLAIVTMSVGLAGCSPVLPASADGELGVLSYEIDAARGPWSEGEALWMEVSAFQVGTGDPAGQSDGFAHEIYVLPEAGTEFTPTVSWSWVDDHVRRAEWEMQTSGDHTVMVTSSEPMEVQQFTPGGQPYGDGAQRVDFVEFDVVVR